MAVRVVQLLARSTAAVIAGEIGPRKSPLATCPVSRCDSERRTGCEILGRNTTGRPRISIAWPRSAAGSTTARWFLVALGQDLVLALSVTCRRQIGHVDFDLKALRRKADLIGLLYMPLAADRLPVPCPAPARVRPGRCKRKRTQGASASAGTKCEVNGHGVRRAYDNESSLVDIDEVVRVENVSKEYRWASRRSRRSTMSRCGRARRLPGHRRPSAAASRRC